MRRWEIFLVFLLGLLGIELGVAEDGGRGAFARLRLAEAYFEQGDDEAGYTWLEQVMGDCPGTREDFAARQLMVRQLLCKSEGRIPGAADIARAKGIVLDALDAGALPILKQAELAYDAARSLHARGTLADEADIYQYALEKLDGGEPRDGELAERIAQLWYALAIADGARCQPEEMARAYDQAATRYPATSCGAHAHLRLGSYYTDRDAARAESEFRAPVDGANVDAYWEAHYYLAVFLVKEGRDAEALPYLDAFLQARPAYSYQCFEHAEALRAGIIAGMEYAEDAR